MAKKGLVIGLVAVGAATLAVVALATKAAPPAKKFVCPLDGLEFPTYDALYQHWITAHPPEVREITWE